MRIDSRRLLPALLIGLVALYALIALLGIPDWVGVIIDLRFAAGILLALLIAQRYPRVAGAFLLAQALLTGANFVAFAGRGHPALAALLILPPLLLGVALVRAGLNRETTADWRFQMMKRIALCAVLFLGCAAAPLDDPALVGELAGTWRGEGHFMNINLEHELGAIAVEIEIHTNGTVSGRIDEARFEGGTLHRWRDSVEIRASLSGRLRADRDVGKDCLVMLITDRTESELTTEFHLKGNFTLDLGMHHCHGTLSRQ